MWIAMLIVLVLIALAAYEFRLRRPDQLVLREVDGKIRTRKGFFYPRHFSLALPGTTHQMEMKVDGITRGGVQIRTALALTVAPGRENLTDLVRVGGWKREAVVKAAREFEAVVQAIVKEHTEKQPFEELSSLELSNHLLEGASARISQFGLELVSLSVQSVDATDPEIALAIRQREASRILEKTELLNQQARIAAARSRLQADEQIAISEHELEIKKYDLRKVELQQEAQLAELRTAEELRRSRLKLAFEKEELDMLRSSPELFLLSPQAARLAEASQDLKNARIIVSLGAGETGREPGLGGMFRQLLHSLLEGERKPLEAGNESPRPSPDAR